MCSRFLLLFLFASYLSSSHSVLVGASVLPHGDFALFPSLLPPGPNRTLAAALHAAALASLTRLTAASPTTVLLIAPHALALSNAFALYESSALAGTALIGGDLHNSSTPLLPVSVSAPGAPLLATQLAAALAAQGQNVSGLLPFGDAVPGPLQWSEVVPMALLAPLLNASARGPSLLVWSQPLRRLSCAACMVPELLALGESLARLLAASEERVWLLASADLSHVHPAGTNPYPANGAVAEAFDGAMGRWAAALDEGALMEAARFADEALSCGFTGCVLLHGALREAGGREARLLAGPSWPTYYGMMVADFLV